MNTAAPVTSDPISGVSWDGNQIVFDLSFAHDQIACAVSRAALEQLAGRRCFRKEDALACFDRHRELIESLAAGKLHARQSGLCGRLTLWADDLDPSDDPNALQQRSA